MRVTTALSVCAVAGMSYAISGLNPGYNHPGYKVTKPLVPHGISVILSAPAVFRFTAASNPERHLLAAEILGAASLCGVAASGRVV